jgi:hypothetical protein
MAPRAIAYVREFTERHREMRTLYRDYRDVADVVNPDTDDAKVGIRGSLPPLKVQSGKTCGAGGVGGFGLTSKRCSRKIGAMELAGLLASRCADAVPPTAVQPRRSRLSGCGAVLGRTTRPSTSPCWRTPRRRRMKDCSRCAPSRSARSSPSGLVSCSARAYRAWCAACVSRRHSPNVWLLTRRRTIRQRACDESHVSVDVLTFSTCCQRFAVLRPSVSQLGAP